MNYPVPQTKAQLLALLDDVRQGIESGDTAEGSIQFTYPSMGDPPDAEFMVLARWRVGCNMGQGGLCSVGAMDRPRPVDGEGRPLCFECLRPQSEHEGGIECPSSDKDSS